MWARMPIEAQQAEEFMRAKRIEPEVVRRGGATGREAFGSDVRICAVSGWYKPGSGPGLDRPCAEPCTRGRLRRGA